MANRRCAREGWGQEQREGPGRNVLVCDHEDGHDRACKAELTRRRREGASARSRGPFRFRGGTSVIDAKNVSSSCAAKAPTTVAAKTVSTLPSASEAANPAASAVPAPVSASLDVKTAHFMYGDRNPPSIEAAPTIIASSGPKATAAKSIGSSEIESSVVLFSRTRPRSATAAIAASVATAHGD